ncbi:ribbon-helix-helix protein, CopG family (plasmid) [Halobaculum sp. CBA1158]|uniref:ribbon-helix-helix protein, CopG family n=1 Tax=Halobaculum sp. CBA1158 TaxID=2904243 RepID=UPI001F258211|nr:ribbon-helix-helix protein, CopG family [Halobaculum sp. CBA1158]UIP01743.1 ribbon-helix-helix protein, CopG family [Halobaculum sp. CBA1158]
MATGERNQLKTDVSDDLDEAVDDLRRAREMQHTSEAVREAIETGVTELGYLSEGPRMTPVRQHVRRIANLLFAASMTLFVLSAVTSAEYSFAGLGVFAGCIFAMGVERFVIPRFEPALSRRLPSLEVKRRGAP